MTTLLIEPFGGMAGDMLLAALLNLGDPRFALSDLEQLASELVPGECRIESRAVRRGGLAATHVSVVTAESDDPPARHLSDLLALLPSSSLGRAARGMAEGVLRRLASAESRVHGIPIERVHFHEVGAVDTLVDVCGACLALERLEVQAAYSSPPLVGDGVFHCAHGELPVPAPGTLALLEGRPYRRGGGEMERLTPTGAALLAECTQPDSALANGRESAWIPTATGYGAGTRETTEGPANLVRVQLLGTAADLPASSAVWIGAFNLDDATGEEVGFAIERLREAGALEVWTHAVQMKKDRPGVVVSALCRGDRRGAIDLAAFAHTPTLGVRWQRFDRTECARDEVVVTLGNTPVRVKRRYRPGASALEPRDLSPEFEDLAAVARTSDRPLRELEVEAIGLALSVAKRDA